MKRVTTPTHKFTLPFKEEQIKELFISYGQHHTEIVKKTKKDCTFDENVAVIKLTQEETKKFVSDSPVKIQARILTVTGEAVSSNIKEVSCEDVINDEVMA